MLMTDALSRQLSQQTILITGASSGIGAACVRLFAGEGARLILLARRSEKLADLVTELVADGIDRSKLYTLTVDVRDRVQVESALAQLPTEWSEIDILINNAGLSRGLNKLQEGEIQDWEEMIDTNIKGLLYVTRAVVPGMVQRGSGYIINLGSIAGHQTYPQGNVYCGTKAAVRSISEGLKIDLLGTPVRVTSIDPGLVDTEFSTVRFHGDTNRAAKVYQGLTPLTAKDIAETILFCLTRPAHVNISELLLVPTAQATPTLVHRE
jgi:3-hydroxy acid dehydrogenase / malonic semialdehyde reductase